MAGMLDAATYDETEMLKNGIPVRIRAMADSTLAEWLQRVPVLQRLLPERREMDRHSGEFVEHWNRGPVNRSPEYLEPE